MVNDNEVVMMVLGTAVIFFVLYKKPQIRQINGWKWLVSAYCFLLAGCLLTILEGFFLTDYLNLLEHFSYTVSAIFLALWCRKMTISKREDPQP
jgi:hypothetical protein